MRAVIAVMHHDAIRFVVCGMRVRGELGHVGVSCSESGAAESLS
jgi:hypothetical protein